MADWYQGQPCTKHADVLAFLESLYCYHCDRLLDGACKCGRPDADAVQRRVSHARSVTAAEKGDAQRARMASLVAGSKPPRSR